MEAFSISIGVIALVWTLIMILIICFLSICFYYPTKESILSLVNYHQFLLSILVLRFNFPTDLASFLHIFKVFKLDFTFIYDMFTSNEYLLFGTIKQQNEQLYGLGYKSGSFMSNYFFFFIVLALIALAHFIYRIIYVVYLKQTIRTIFKNPEEWDRKISYRISKQIHWWFNFDIYIVGFWEWSTFILFNLINEIQNFRGDSASNYLSLFFLWGFISFWIFIWIKVILKQKANDDFNFFSCLFNDLNQENNKMRIYYVTFFVRRITVVITTLMIYHWKAQWVAWWGIQWLAFAFYFQTRPFKLIVSNLNMLILEGTLIVFLTSVIWMPDINNNSYNSKNNELLGVAVSWLLFLSIIIVLVIVSKAT